MPKIDDLAGHGGGLEKIQRSPDASELIRAIEGFSGRVAERVVEERGSWGLDRLGDRPGRGERGGGDSRFFDVSCDQTDRLVADRSHRDQQNGVDLLLEKLLRDGWGQVLAHSTGRVDASHEGDGLWRELPDLACVDEV